MKKFLFYSVVYYVLIAFGNMLAVSTGNANPIDGSLVITAIVAGPAVIGAAMIGIK